MELRLVPPLWAPGPVISLYFSWAVHRGSLCGGSSLYPPGPPSDLSLYRARDKKKGPVSLCRLSLSVLNSLGRLSLCLEQSRIVLRARCARCARFCYTQRLSLSGDSSLRSLPYDYHINLYEHHINLYEHHINLYEHHINLYGLKKNTESLRATARSLSVQWQHQQSTFTERVSLRAVPIKKKTENLEQAN